MPLSSTSIAYAAFVCSMLDLLVWTSINLVAHLIAPIASSSCNLGLLSCFFVHWVFLGRMPQFLAHETSTLSMTLHLLGLLGRSLLIGGFNLVGPTLVWTHSPLMSIQSTTIAHPFSMFLALGCVGLAWDVILLLALEEARFEPFSSFFTMLSRLSWEGYAFSLPFNWITSFLSLSTSSLSSWLSKRFFSIEDWRAWEAHSLVQVIFNGDGVQVSVCVRLRWFYRCDHNLMSYLKHDMFHVSTTNFSCEHY